MASQLRITDENNVRTITLARPECHNAFDEALIHDLLEAFRSTAADTRFRVVVLAAEGKSFSAGADLSWMKRMANYSYEDNVKDALKLASLMQTLKSIPIPTIARVQGATYGGGVGLVACCDIAIASDIATFALSEVTLGLIPAVISPYVIKAIGETAARRYFLTGEKFSAARAYALGLISEVVAPPELDITVQKVTNQLLSNGPHALIAAKSLINRLTEENYDSSQQNAELIALIRATNEAQEGLTAFFEKRAPNWRVSTKVGSHNKKS